MKKVIYVVTGASGHLGNTVVQKLKELGGEIREFLLPTDIEINNLPKSNIYRGDITKKETLDDIFKTKEDEELVVIHCAGIVSISSKYSQIVHDVNVEGTRNIVDMCKKSNVKKFIYVSSVHAIPEGIKGSVIKEINDFNPDDVVGLYAKTKAEATKIVLNSVKDGVPAVIVHPSGIVGPNDYGHGHMTQLVKSYCGGSLTAGITGGFDFVDVRDVADGIISSIKNGKVGECYILSNRYYSIKEILGMLHDITGYKEIKTYLPYWFINSFAALAELYYKLRKESPLFTKYSIYTLRSNSNFSHDKATEELDYNPRKIEESLKDTILFLRKNGKIKQ